MSPSYPFFHPIKLQLFQLRLPNIFLVRGLVALGKKDRKKRKKEGKCPKKEKLRASQVPPRYLVSK